MIWSWILVRYPSKPHAGSEDPGFVRFRMRSDRTERFIKNYCIIKQVRARYVGYFRLSYNKNYTSRMSFFIYFDHLVRQICINMVEIEENIIKMCFKTNKNISNVLIIIRISLPNITKQYNGILG